MTIVTNKHVLLLILSAQKMNTKQGQKCRLCFVIGFFHINLFNTSQNVAAAIREIFQCEVINSLIEKTWRDKSHYFADILFKGEWIWCISKLHLRRLLDEFEEISWVLSQSTSGTKEIFIGWKSDGQNRDFPWRVNWWHWLPRWWYVLNGSCFRMSMFWRLFL